MEQAEAANQNAREAAGHTFLTQGSLLSKKGSKAQKTVGKSSFIKQSAMADDDDYAAQRPSQLSMAEQMDVVVNDTDETDE